MNLYFIQVAGILDFETHTANSSQIVDTFCNELSVFNLDPLDFFGISLKGANLLAKKLEWNCHFTQKDYAILLKKADKI